MQGAVEFLRKILADQMEMFKKVSPGLFSKAAF